MILWYSILFTTILVLGVKIVTHNDMLLHGFKLAMINRIGEKASSLLIMCEWCMPSVYSLFGYGFAYIFAGGFPLTALIFYPITVAASSVCSGVIWVIILLLLEYLKLFDNNN